MASGFASHRASMSAAISTKAPSGITPGEAATFSADTHSTPSTRNILSSGGLDRITEAEIFFNPPAVAEYIVPLRFLKYLQLIDYLTPLYATTLLPALLNLKAKIYESPSNIKEKLVPVISAINELNAWIDSEYHLPIPTSSIAIIMEVVSNIKIYEKESGGHLSREDVIFINLNASYDAAGSLPFEESAEQILITQSTSPLMYLFYFDVIQTPSRFGDVGLEALLTASEGRLNLTKPRDIELLYKYTFLRDLPQSKQKDALRGMREFFLKNYQPACLEIFHRFLFGKTPVKLTQYIDLQRTSDLHTLSITFRFEDVYICDELFPDSNSRPLRLAQKHLMRCSIRTTFQETIVNDQPRMMLQSVALSGPDAAAFGALINLCTWFDETKVSKALLDIKSYQDYFSYALSERSQLINALTAHLDELQQIEAIETILTQFNLAYFLPTNFMNDSFNTKNEEALLNEVMRYGHCLALVLKTFFKDFNKLNKIKRDYLLERQKLIASTTLALGKITELLRCLSKDDTTRIILGTTVQPKWLSAFIDANDEEIKSFIRVLFRSLNYKLKQQEGETTSTFEILCHILVNHFAPGWPQKFAEVLESIYRGGNTTSNADIFEVFKAKSPIFWGLPRTLSNGLAILRAPAVLSYATTTLSALTSLKEQVLFYLNVDITPTGNYFKLIADEWFKLKHSGSLDPRIYAFLATLKKDAYVKMEKASISTNQFEVIYLKILEYIDPSWHADFSDTWELLARENALPLYSPLGSAPSNRFPKTAPPRAVTSSAAATFYGHSPKLTFDLKSAPSKGY